MDFRCPVALFQKPVNNRGGIEAGFGILSRRFLGSHPWMNSGVWSEFIRSIKKNARMFHIFFDIILDHPGIQLSEKRSV
jgi:hypothetical protein